MKRILALVFMCGAGSCVAADAAAARQTVPLTAAQKKANDAAHARAAAALFATMAPADEYFGPLKLSIIGIQNTMRDIGLRYKYNNNLAAPSFASAQLVESALRDWQHRYANDPQLPHNVYNLQRLYTQILLQRSRDRAGVIAKWMAVTFPTSAQERQLKKTLALEHLAPIPTPSPTPVPTDSPTPTDSPVPTAEPSVEPTASDASDAPARAAPTAGRIPIASPAPRATATATPGPSPEPTAGASPPPEPTAGASPAPAPPR